MRGLGEQGMGERKRRRRESIMTSRLLRLNRTERAKGNWGKEKKFITGCHTHIDVHIQSL